ncbi:MAG: hypothetical protein ACXABD_21090 [Candidatus Thorarchaeota archaeon]|jgi:hypothetical protein
MARNIFIYQCGHHTILIVESVERRICFNTGLWFLVVGYYFYIFIFLLLFRWRKTRNPFQFAMALFFLLLAVGRVFFFIADFYADIASLPDALPDPWGTPYFSDGAGWLAAGSFFQWMALAILSATAGFMIFGNRAAEIGFAIPAVLIGIVLAMVPLDAFNRLLLSGGAGAIYALFIPLLFWYLAWQSGGMLRKSNFMLGFGFFVLFAGRVIHAIRDELATYVFGSATIPGILAPGLIIIALILIVTGSEWGQAQ